MEEQTQVVAVRIPKTTYAILVHKSKDWEMSISSLIREIIEKIYDENSNDYKIKNYRKRKENRIVGTTLDKKMKRKK